MKNKDLGNTSKHYGYVKKKPVSKTKPTSKTTASKPEKTVSEISKNTSANVQKVLKTAKSYIGTPYKYAGNTKSGIDCSGLTCAAYRSINVNLPRIAYDQDDVGKSVSIDRLQAGDLIFFGAKKGSKSITHVGMVVQVKSKAEIIFIHASSSRGVREDNLLSTYYRPLFIKASRPLAE
ncbi:MAG: C40 family peptidase [Verrucomicrobia bacterium]|nr:C40 family peptidase [Cytophagales bacterium]